MIRHTLLALTATLSLTARAHAESAPAARPADPAQQALAQMVSEAQNREAGALIQVYALRAEIAEMGRRLAAETKRADAAVEKAKPSEAAEPPKP